MPIDINIMCVQQNSDIIECKTENFFLERLNYSLTDDKIYKDNWFLYNAIMGIGYNLYSKNKDETFSIVDYRETKDINPYMKYMLQDEKKPSNSNLDSTLCSIIFSKNYLGDFERLLESFIKNSQIKTCLVFFRLQISSPERYVGRISLKQFISLLKQEEIYLNTAYIISENEYD